MIRAVIVDDEANGIKSLELLIAKYCPNVRVVSFTTSAVDAIKLINDYCPDVVFLDIQMPELNGFELLERLEYRNFQLIFTTAYEEYAIKAIKENALDYLLKPIIGKDLQNACLKVEERIRNNQKFPDFHKLLSELSSTEKKKIAIQTKESIEIVKKESVLYLESFSKKTEVILNDNKKIVSIKSLKEFETALCIPNSYFIRIHNSFIINLSHIKRYFKGDDFYILMSDGRKITVAKQNRREFMVLIDRMGKT